MRKRIIGRVIRIVPQRSSVPLRRLILLLRRLTSSALRSRLSESRIGRKRHGSGCYRQSQERRRNGSFKFWVLGSWEPVRRRPRLRGICFSYSEVMEAGRSCLGRPSKVILTPQGLFSSPCDVRASSQPWINAIGEAYAFLSIPSMMMAHGT